MRYYEINENIGRRGFLQGLGAAAGLGAVGYGAVQQKQRPWSTPEEPTRDGIRSVDVPTQPGGKSAPAAAKPGEQKYSPGSVRSPEFAKKLRHIAALLGVNPNDLLKVMYFETKGTLDPSIQNSIGATGLIQFLPKTAVRELKTTTDNLKMMSAEQQLNYVYHYYKNKVKPGMTAGDIYLATLLPIALKLKDNTIVARKNDKTKIPGSDIQRHSMFVSNPVFRRPDKNYYTVSDIKSVINSRSAPTIDSLPNYKFKQ